ncbi:MAG: hypothetical protein JRJ09_16255 [Deltaproteobacteria bacterium]|nr:hypothetical protein [Deltaproteobacteria bacterium]MBW2050061.1 hypothetical protein [Deltaproteobacteria bacterium]MBW2112462.1 hypothetical protein [Deltaproteobacteria bacterium]
MMGLKELKESRPLVDSIDWEMTPEEAVRLYLEWGNNWSRGYRMVRSKSDETYYFVLNTWEDIPTIFFIRRDYEGAEELARVEMPQELKERFQPSENLARGVFAVDGELREWLRDELDVC